MIDSISFGHSPVGSKEDVEIKLSPITLIVGPNNSGKSVALRQINAFCRTPLAKVQPSIITGLSISKLSEPQREEIWNEIEAWSAGNVKSSEVFLDPLGQSTRARNVLQRELQMGGQSAEFRAYIVGPRTRLLDGVSRIQLVQPQRAGDLLTGNKGGIFQRLLTEDSLRREVRRITHDAFGKWLVIDSTHHGQLRLRYSNDEPSDSIVERSYTDEAIQFHRRATSIDEMSDGVKAFTGMLLEAFASASRILLIDEPEAFLHPSLARKLGSELSLRAGRPGHRLICATHSADFLMGCIQSGREMHVVRRTYLNNESETRILDSTTLKLLMQEPMLRSVGVLQAIFYSAVIVTEGDSDRCFYQEINERLILAEDDRAVKDGLFLNAQNWQTEARIVQPLRKLGIPAAAVVDLDVLGSKGSAWALLLDAICFPPSERDALGQWRSKVMEGFHNLGLDPKKDGIKALPPDRRESALSLLERVSKYGLFIVPGGELESWLSGLGGSTRKEDWIAAVFKEMGADPTATDYMRPTNGDIWDFVGKIASWTGDPQRLGIPSP